MMTMIFMGINVAVYLLQWIIPNFTNQLVLMPAIAAYEPWRIITSAFAHSTGSFWHILMNMYGVYIFGMLLEPRLGRLRFAVLYLLSALGGSLGVMLLSHELTATLGASGALAGLFLATFVVLRGNKQAISQMAIILGLNVVLGFMVAGISWQAHLGGALVGLAAAACIVLVPRKNPQRSKIQFGLLSALGVVVIIGLYMTTMAKAWPLG